jgi:hypothetical protein
MATKSTKYVGNGYWENASKQLKWAVNIPEKYISVPETELNEAKESLMIQHFCNNGFHIQSCIPSFNENRVFDPEIRLKMASVKIAPDDSAYHVGDRFMVVSTYCELEITNVESKKIHLKYLNRNKHNLLQSDDLLNHNLDFKLWKRI